MKLAVNEARIALPEFPPGDQTTRSQVHFWGPGSWVWTGRDLKIGGPWLNRLTKPIWQLVSFCMYAFSGLHGGSAPHLAVPIGT